MKTIHRYISGDFIVTFIMTLLVFTFVMSIGVVFKVNDLLARGVAWRPILKIVIAGMPAVLSISIPISVMTSSLLIFGRLSSDGEITAMRACGISMWEIASRPVLLGAALSAICLYVNSELSPRSHLAMNILKLELGIEAPLEMLDVGRFISDFSGLTIYIGSKRDSLLEQVRIYDTRTAVKREIRADTGMISADKSGTNMVLTLNNVRIDPINDTGESGFCESYILTIPNAIRKAEYVKRDGDLLIGELAARIMHDDLFFSDMSWDDRARRTMVMTVELWKRIVLSVSCFAFAILGMPLGVKSHRKESSMGMAIGLLLFFSFYLFVVIAENLAASPALRPDLIIWLPVFISIFIGAKLIRRAN